MVERRQPPCWIPVGALHLQNVRAKIGQHLGGIRAGNMMRKVNYLYAVQRSTIQNHIQTAA